MKTRLFFAILSILFIATIVSCSDDDEPSIYFTQDDIIGDINTGKQKTITAMSVYNGYTAGCSVCGYQGKVTAKSSDENIATATISHGRGGMLLSVEGKATGKAIVTVSDEAGQTATLQVSVSTLPRKKYLCKRSTITVNAANPADAEEIKLAITDSIANMHYLEIEKTPTMPDSNSWRLYIYNSSSQLINELHGFKLGEGGNFEFSQPDSEISYNLQFSDTEINIDLTPLYMLKYTGIEYVSLSISVEAME